MTDLRVLLAQNLKKLRAENGFSQKKLAEKTDISTHYLGMIEIKRKFPTPELLARLAEALNVDTPELFSIPPTPAGVLKKLETAVLTDLQSAVQKAVEKSIADQIEKIENGSMQEY